MDRPLTEYVGTVEAGERLDLTSRFIQGECAANRLPHIKFRGQYLIDPDDLEHWARTRRIIHRKSD